MRKTILIIAVGIFMLIGQAPKVCADYPGIYQYYMELGKQSVNEKDYNKAIEYFQLARLMAPSQEEPLSYINLIKRLKEGRVNILEKRKDSHLLKSSPVIARDQKYPASNSKQRNEVDKALDVFEKSEGPVHQRPSPPTTPLPKGNIIIPERKVAVFEQPTQVILDDELFNTQPKTTLRIELNSSITLEGRNIERFLVVTPDFIKVETIDRNHIKITPLKRGSTYLHVWDDKGRWTFNIEIILPIQKASTVVREMATEEYEEPFKFAYSTDWSSYYLGQSFPELERQNINFWQWGGIYGKTPYGDFDAGLTYNKFQESTELTGKTVGLTNGHLGDFNDFSIRGYDASSNFSPLTLPGQSFRGILVNSLAFNHNLAYTYLQGQNRSIFGTLTAGVLQERQSFIEGTKVTLFPESPNNYSVNFARGYGEAREDFLKKRVVSLEAKHQLSHQLSLAGEVAYDEDTFAETLSSVMKGDNYNLNIGLRDIDKDFTTITSLPSNRGEVGGAVTFDWKLADVDTSSFLDLYRDRFLPNVDHPDALNLDFNTSIGFSPSTNDNIRASLYYLDTPGELSPRQNLRTNSAYWHKFHLTENRDLATSLGLTYQRSRFDLSPASDYDRYSLTSGFSVPVISSLSYFANFEYSWVKDILTGDHSRPTVFNTGFNYSKKIVDDWTGNLSLYYRDEERTEGKNSFLAGEDSLTGGVGVSYRPSPDFEFFVDTRVRNVWAESVTSTAFNDLDIRTGVRSAWELPLRWNPLGIIKGTVYKDLNGNHIQDKDEAGIPNVAVKIGRQTAFTDHQGRYEMKVRAKSVQVNLDVESIPEGFIFSTPNIINVKIVQSKEQVINFGLTTQSGIYGIVFVDINNNGKPDAGDQFIPKAKIVLDETKTAVTDYEGIYYFQEISPGKHTLRIIVNSLPLEYLPKVKISNDVEVTEGTTYVFHIPLVSNQK